MDSASAREDRHQGVKYHFVDHLTSVPSVNFLCFASAEGYSALKKRSALVATALETVEKCASHAYARLGQPTVEQLSGPLQVVDDLACKVLQKLENRCPAISKKPHEIIADGRDFGKRKYSVGQAYAREKINVCRDLFKRVVNAACQPVGTVTSIVRCSRAIVWQQLVIAESACDAYIKGMDEGDAPDADPRNCTLPLILHLGWKASLCVSHYAIVEHQRAKGLFERTIATATSMLEEPAEPLRKPTTASEHASAAFRHVVKLSAQLGRVYADAFVRLYQMAWTSLSAQFSPTEPIKLELLYDEAPPTSVNRSPASGGDPDDLNDDANSTVCSGDPDDSKLGSPAPDCDSDDSNDDSNSTVRSVEPDDSKEGSLTRSSDSEDSKDESPARSSGTDDSNDESLDRSVDAEDSS